jgi:BirA family biotin operon repressor/biotin-[acetyl-CoA-carboxylase] ligase
VWLAEADSTNLVAARLVASWADDDDDRLGDTLVVAGAQTAGRGRGEHVWESPVGGLYATWLGWIEVAELAWLPIAAGVCLAEAIAAAVPGLAPRLKWPNDVLAGGGKLGGILCQSRTRGGDAWVSVGIGVNVEVAPVLANGGAAPAACLREHGLVGATEAAIQAVVDAFAVGLRPALARRYELVAEWLRRTVHRHGDILRLRTGDGVLRGAFVGMSDDGRLELEVNGGTHRISAGELVGAMPKPAAEE